MYKLVEVQPGETARPPVDAATGQEEPARLQAHLLEPRLRPACERGDPERERGRVLLLGDAVLGDVAVEVVQAGQRYAELFTS
jgi:hypothetical protein